MVVSSGKRRESEDDVGRQQAQSSKSKRSRKKEAQAAAELEEERRLTALLFGTTSGDNDQLLAHHQHQQTLDLQQRTLVDSDTAEDVPLFEIDRTGDAQTYSILDSDKHKRSSTEKHGVDDDRSGDDSSAVGEDNNDAAWVDDDDEQLAVNILETNRLRKLRKSRAEEAASALPGTEMESRLRLRFQTTTQVTARTDWAKLDQSESPEQQNDVRSAAFPIFSDETKYSQLPSGILNVVRCPDANQSDPNQAVVQSVHFHPGSDSENPLLLTAGLDKTLRFFQVGTEKSVKVHGIHFPKLPICTASFLGSTGNVVVSGRRSFFYIYDAAAGKLDLIPKIRGREEKSLERLSASTDGRTIAFMGNDGYIILFDAQRKQWVADLKMNGSVRALSFSTNGEQLLGSGSDGDVYRWDLRTRQCIERFPNEDGTITSYLAASSRHLAVGAESGVVNLFNDQIRSDGNKRTPIKSILNLQTSADMVRFNHDGQILAMSTRRERDGLKLLHVPSATVFSNWPTSKTPLGYVWSHDFSPESRFLAVGNDKGKCLLYQLGHYSNQ